jgi:hypothetical protein
MSLSPADRPQPSTDAGATGATFPVPAPSVAPALRTNRLWTVCFIFLALEVGGFLSVFPWIDAWHLNHFRAFFPSASALWDDAYFRGAVTGLGIANLLVALGQSLHLIRSLRKTRV